MEIEVLDSGVFGAALVHLMPGETFVSESGALYRASGNVDIDVTTRARGGGGFFGGLKRMLASEHFFFSTYSVTNGQPGEVGLAPIHLGEVKVVDVESSMPWLCAGGCYIGSTSELAIDTQYQGMRGLLSGESLFFLKVSGQGQFLASAFGRIVELNVRDSITVDTGHLVAFEESLQYTIGKAGGSWIQSFLAGEGVVMHFTGTGKILVQSHNTTGFGRVLGPMLPERN